MFYKIDNDYYVLVGDKYMQVKFSVDGEELNSTPTGKELERNTVKNVKPQPFDDDFKKQFIDKKYSNKEDTKSRYRFGR